MCLTDCPNGLNSIDWAVNLQIIFSLDGIEDLAIYPTC